MIMAQKFWEMNKIKQPEEEEKTVNDQDDQNMFIELSDSSSF